MQTISNQVCLSFNQERCRVTIYLVPVGLVEDGPAEDDHVEDDDEAVEDREGGHLTVTQS